MAKENVGIDFRPKKVDETRNYLLDDIKYNDLMSKKHKNFLVFVSAVSACVPVYAFASLVGVPVSIPR